MLRKLRVIAALISFLLIAFLFLDYTGSLHKWFGFMAKIQLFPAILALNFIVIIALILLTLIFGRLYCSVICPLGVLQDIISRVAGKFKKRRFTYSPALNLLRYIFLALFIVSFFAGFSVAVSLIEPYSAFGRVVSNLFAPLYKLANNGLALVAQHYNSYMFYHTSVFIKGLSVFVTAIVTFIIIAILAWRNGRTYCNTVCPVGTFLGLLSRISYLKPVIDKNTCNNCGLCTRNCKASCIDFKNHTIDYSRCVTCFNCIDTCKVNAIKYSHKKSSQPQNQTHSNTDNSVSRRKFLTVSALFAFTATIKAQEKKIDGGLAYIEDKKAPERENPVTPPGSLNSRNFAQKCTACQLCVSVCPNNILYPSANINNLMQPYMSFERGYCRPECVKCSEVCPTGAITQITVADKSAIQIGHAVWIKENCVVFTDNVSCDNCARHCPVNAIQMVASDSNNPESLKFPVVNTERCIGCGACENLCPARPFSALVVHGNLMHRTV